MRIASSGEGLYLGSLAVQGFSLSPSLQLNWQIHKNSYPLSFKIFDDILYYYDGRFQGLSLKTGETRWQIDVLPLLQENPSAGKQMAFRLSPPRFEEISLMTGEIGWSLATTVQAVSYYYHQVYQKMAYLDHYGQQFYAIDLLSGQIFWEIAHLLYPKNNLKINGSFPNNLLDLRRETLLSTLEGFIYLPTLSAVEARDFRTGELAWSFASTPYGGLGEGLPLAVGERLLFEVASTQAFALEAKSGATLWQTPLPGRVEYPGFKAQGDTVYFTTGGLLIALDSLTGKILWQVPIPEASGQGYRLTFTPEALYVVGDQEGVHAFERNRGKVLWRWTTPTLFVSEVVVRGADVYFAAQDKNDLKLRVFHLDALTGSEKTQLQR